MASSRWSAFLSSARRMRTPPSSSSLSPSASSSSPPDNGVDVRLSPVLGARELVLLGIGASIGSGIFVVTGVAAQDAGPAVSLSFLLAGLASVADALAYAELAGRFPGQIGGAYLYCYGTFGELSAFVLFCQLMLDYHIGAASIARSLASHVAALWSQLNLAGNLTSGGSPASGESLKLGGGSVSGGAMAALREMVVGEGGVHVGGGGEWTGILAVVLLAVITGVLCRGAKESTAVNGIMTLVKICIVVVVIVVGVTKVTPSNWVPFFPNGYSAVFSASSVVFFSYVGFDAVANTAEESRNPARDIPIGILGSLGVCASLYVGVAVVLTGMVPYAMLDPAAPLAEAFVTRGLPAVSAVIDVGAVVGLATTLLAGLYVQSRLYMVLGRDGFVGEWIAGVHTATKAPVRAQILVGAIAASMAATFNVSALAHILSVGVLCSYSVVCVCVVAHRIDPNPKSLSSLSSSSFSRWEEAMLMAACTALFSFLTGLSTRFALPWSISLVCLLLTLAPLGPLYLRQVYLPPPGFPCPLVPALPIVGMAFNIYLVAQMHVEAYIRIVVVTLVSVLVYYFYGQFHAGREVTDSVTADYVAIGQRAAEPVRAVD